MAHRWVGTFVFAALALPLAGPAATQTHTGAAGGSRVGFGAAIAIAGDELLIGRPGELSFFPSPPNHAGTVHVYARGAGGWAERARIAVESIQAGDGFANVLAVDGTLLVIGAARESDGRGAAYVFAREQAGWRQVARLADPAGSPGDAFGSAVAVRGDLALVGAPGRAGGTGGVAVFRRAVAGWTLAGWLDAGGVSAADAFGTDVAFDGRRAAVGAPGPMPALGMFGTLPPRPGQVHVFAIQPDGTSRREARLDFGGALPASLGVRVLLAGDEAYAAAPLANQGMGTIVRYTRDAAGTWREAQRITAPDQTPSGTFANGLTLAGEHLFAGSPQDGGAGALYIFRRAQPGSSWAHLQTVRGEAPFGGFGATVAAAADDAYVGAPGADFFEGSTAHYRRNARGEWARVETVVTEMTTLDPVTGGAVTCSDGKASAFSCSSVDLVAFLPLSAIGGKRGNIVNDLWGWTDPLTGREIAIVGRNDATTFIDVTNAANPVYLGELPLHAGATPNIWRDIKVYADHAFIVADGAGRHGMQVFDLRQLRDVRNPPVPFTETAHYDRVYSAHNIVINEATGTAFIAGGSMGGETCGGGLHMVDIRRPATPVFAGCFADTRTGLARTGYSHDAQCITYDGPDAKYRGREICFGSNESMLSISDVTDKAKPVPVAAVGYPNSAYLHQGWVTEDHRYLYMNDEGDEVAGTVPRTRTLVWDIAQLEDPILVKEYLGETAASDHNLYVKGNYVYESNYVSGLRILDITDRANPVEVGFFDTVPFGPDRPGFAGSWSNYPYFASGNIIVTSMREGVFILKQRPTRPIS